MSDFSLEFSGSIPENYDRYIFPVSIKPFATEMTQRVSLLRPSSVLETAAGTGSCSAEIMASLSSSCRYVVTDISDPMLNIARAKLADRVNAEFKQTDACSLPYSDESFDTVVSMYGLMFFPNQVQALQEARRVLKKKGVLMMSVWDAIEFSPLGQLFYKILTARYGFQHARFKEVPHRCASIDKLKRQLEAAEFTEFEFSVVRKTIDPSSIENACRGYVYGTPLHNEFIELGSDPDEVLEHLVKDIRSSQGDMLTGFYRQSIFVKAIK